MELWKPYMLWGALTVAIPILIHFWHQKRGTVMAWATTQWLLERSQQQQRGLRLENLLLLLLRCLVLLLLALLLSWPVLDAWKTEPTTQRVHLVQPDALVTENFRFELEEAVRRGEKVYWISNRAEPANDLTQVPDQTRFNPLSIQSVVNQVRHAGEPEVHFYLVNRQELAELPSIQVPSSYQLNTLVDSTRNLPQAFLETSPNQKLFVDENQRLVSSKQLPASIRFQQEPIRRGSLSVVLDYKNEDQQQTVEAALKAFSEVYQVPIEVKKGINADELYDWVLTDQFPKNPSPTTLYVISNDDKQPFTRNVPQSTMPNVLYTPEVLTPGTSGRVSSGQLPEWLGELLLRHLGLTESSHPLNQQELAGLFVAAETTSTSRPFLDQTLQNYLLLVLLLLVGGERWMALRKNA